jgi:hypothetical protein
MSNLTDHGGELFDILEETIKMDDGHLSAMKRRGMMST